MYCNSGIFSYIQLFFGQNSGFPEYIRTLGILSVISVIVLMVGVFIKEVGVEQVIPEDMDKKSNAKIFLTIFGVAIASRLIIYFIGYLYSIQALNLKAGFFEGFNSMWNKWDTVHYLNLAQNGYAASGENAKLIVFYPLYSLLVGIVARIIGNYLLAGVIVSDLSLGIGCFYLYKLARVDFDEETAVRSVKYMLIYPFSFFFGIVYTESLFVALSLMSLYYMRRNKWLAAGICGFLAALTKNQGIILIVPVFIEYVLSTQLFMEIRKKNYKNIMKSFLTKGIYMFMIPLGTFVYLLINKILFGSWNAFIVYQKKDFNNSFGNVFDNLRKFARLAVSPESNFRLTYWIPCILSFLLVVFLIFYSIGRLRLSYSAYMLVFLLVSYSPSWLLSGSRYIMSLVPIYIGLSVLSKRKEVDIVLTFTSTMLLGFFTFAFLMGRVL
ncbi:MAG TPA: glycosyltransferase family 39 protein [Acetivibrio clariflavus]|nr:glycosyltransferase family 39 protein [Acetivibrio clariflavus]